MPRLVMRWAVLKGRFGCAFEGRGEEGWYDYSA